MLPNPFTANSNVVLSGLRFRSPNPKLQPAGKVYLYRATGAYRFFLRQPVFPSSDGAWMGWSPVAGRSGRGQALFLPQPGQLLRTRLPARELPVQLHRQVEQLLGT